MFGLLAAAAQVAASSWPYLTVVGPSALRFETPRRAATNSVFPPLVVPVEPSDSSGSFSAPTNMVDASIPTTATANVTIPTLDPLLATNLIALANTNAPVQATVVEPQVLAPNIFLRYFTRTSNASPTTPAASVVVPMGFTPPTPSFSPPSKAAYSTTP